VNAKSSRRIPEMAVLETIPVLFPVEASSSSSSFLSTSTIIALTVFFALLCACIVIGHLLEENRWANESITALLLVLGIVFT
jgi:sodium/hydrogen exchanger 8